MVGMGASGLVVVDVDGRVCRRVVAVHLLRRLDIVAVGVVLRRRVDLMPVVVDLRRGVDRHSIIADMAASP